MNTTITAHRSISQRAVRFHEKNKRQSGRNYPNHPEASAHILDLPSGDPTRSRYSHNHNETSSKGRDS